MPLNGTPDAEAPLLADGGVEKKTNSQKVQTDPEEAVAPPREIKKEPSAFKIDDFMKNDAIKTVWARLKTNLADQTVKGLQGALDEASQELRNVKGNSPENKDKVKELESKVRRLQDAITYIQKKEREKTKKDEEAQ